MSLLLIVWGQVVLSLPWGDPRARDFWQFYGAELRKTSAYNAPHAYTLLLNGANQFGLPYQTDNPRLSDWGDSVVCDCIRLDSIGPVFISFAYQAGGRMEPPEADDTLTLWGQNAAGEWRPLWQTQGTGLAETTFTAVSLFLSDAQWLHPCFRLKWTTWGSTYGAYDNWHIAYTLIRPDSLPLYPVWNALPRTYDKVYGTWGVGYDTDSVFALLSGNGNTEVEVQVLVNRQRIYRQMRLPSPAGDTVTIKLPKLSVPDTYRVEWLLNWGVFRPESLRLIDTVVLDGYTWGYDDGEMESGYGLRQPNRAFCQVFRIDTAQRLARVGVRFFPVPTQYGKPFQLGVWDMQAGLQPLYLKFERVLIDSVGGWQWFEIDTPLIVQGEIGVGFIQADNQPLGVGWDASYSGVSRVRIETAGGWTPSQIEGCMMLRIQLQPASTALASHGLTEAGVFTIRGQVGEPVRFPSGFSLPIKVWSLDGRLMGAYTAEYAVFAQGGLYVATDAVGRSCRLLIMP